ncbi:MAG: hypothetical protein WAN94_24465, partial [Pseudolabrys sp.]
MSAQGCRGPLSAVLLLFAPFSYIDCMVLRSSRGRPIFPTSAAMKLHSSALKLHSSAPRELVVAILMIAAIPVFVQAKKPSAAIVTHTDVRKVLEIIKGDKAKTQTYCNMVKLGHEMAAADEKKTDELNQKMGELQKKLGTEYAALMEGFQDIDLGSEVGQ